MECVNEHTVCHLSVAVPALIPGQHIAFEGGVTMRNLVSNEIYRVKGQLNRSIIART